MRPMTTRITFQKETVKEIQEKLCEAYISGDLRLVRRLSVLLGMVRGEDLDTLVKTWKITCQTAYNWLKSFIEERWQGLPYLKPSGRPARLTKSQKQELYEVVQAGPEAAGYSCGCWNSCMIQEWILQKFKVLYNRFYVCELLRHLGLSYQKARFISDHLDEDARREWLQEEWPAILAQAQQLNVPIFFGDEVSFAQWGSLSYTWAPKGNQPEIPTSGIRKGYKVFGIIEFFTGQFIYQGTTERFNSESYAEFLKSVLAKMKGKLILIQDGARYHTSKATREFIEQHKDRLIVYQLPSYSPDYNPIEFLWKKVKTNATHNRYFAEFAKLTQSVDDALALLSTQADEIKCLMGVYVKKLADPLPA
jgi:transposase